MMADYYTDTHSLMNAIKYNLRQFSSSNLSMSLSKVKSWATGFVFPETVFPAITVFPLTKRFRPRRSGGFQHVEYHFSIDIYSSRHIKLSESKKFCLELVDDVKECLKGTLRMIDAGGRKHCFTTSIISEITSEEKGATDRGFMSTASLGLVCLSYHQMNSGRMKVSVVNETDFNRFFDKVVFKIKQDISDMNLFVKEWILKVSRPVTTSSCIMVLPGDETVDEFYTGSTDMLLRPIDFHVISRGYPRKQILKENSNIADALVSIIERNYKVDGYALTCDIDSIDYHYEQKESGFEFFSTIKTVYNCPKTFSRIVR